MNKSEQVNELFAAMAKAQRTADRFIESQLIPPLAQLIRPLGEGRGGGHRRFSPLARFISRVSFGASDCWYWRGRIERDGYGTFGAVRAHRVAYQLFIGEIPPGLVIRHSCDVRNCVNPAHLLAGTHAENIRDRNQRGRSFNKSKLTPADTMVAGIVMRYL